MNKSSVSGKVSQIVGPVVDIFFKESLPNINDALKVKDRNVILEVQQHIGSGQVRAIAMSSTDGMSRGQEVIALGEPISVPVGNAILGRMFNVTGDPIDGKGNPATKKRYSIHRPAPKFVDQKIDLEVLETGIKVIDLICPFLKGGKTGLFGGAGVGKTIVIQELI